MDPNNQVITVDIFKNNLPENLSYEFEFQKGQKEPNVEVVLNLLKKKGKPLREVLESCGQKYKLFWIFDFPLNLEMFLGSTPEVENNVESLNGIPPSDLSAISLYSTTSVETRENGDQGNIS